MPKIRKKAPVKPVQPVHPVRPQYDPMTPAINPRRGASDAYNMNRMQGGGSSPVPGVAG